MAGFVDPRKVVARESAFSALPSARNGTEKEKKRGKTKS
jgi:hypothetical protein